MSTHASKLQYLWGIDTYSPVLACSHPQWLSLDRVSLPSHSSFLCSTAQRYTRLRELERSFLAASLGKTWRAELKLLEGRNERQQKDHPSHTW